MYSNDEYLDEIMITGLEIYAYHGVFARERKEGQTFLVDLRLYTDTRPAGSMDNLELSTDYGDVSLFVQKWMKENTQSLIESVAEKLAREILQKYSKVQKLEVTIHKPEAPIKVPFGDVYVKIIRGWHRVYLSVGSNMGDKGAYIEKAVEELKNCPDIRFRRSSEIIVTKPYGGVEQDDFLNGCLEIDTLYTPLELLDCLHEIEAGAGRERKIHWGPRTLDLDILLYENLILDSEELTIPHQDMANRAFVLDPLIELCPHMRHPVLDKSILTLQRELHEREGR